MQFVGIEGEFERRGLLEGQTRFRGGVCLAIRLVARSDGDQSILRREAPTCASGTLARLAIARLWFVGGTNAGFIGHRPSLAGGINQVHGIRAFGQTAINNIEWAPKLPL